MWTNLSLLLCSVFQQCPRPDEQVQQDLSVKLGMGANQVKFWFQNRRSAKKVDTFLFHGAIVDYIRFDQVGHSIYAVIVALQLKV